MELDAHNTALTAAAVRQVAFGSVRFPGDRLAVAEMTKFWREWLLNHNYPDMRIYTGMIMLPLDYFLSGIRLIENNDVPRDQVLFVNPKGEVVGKIVNLEVPKEGPDGRVQVPGS